MLNTLIDKIFTALCLNEKENLNADIMPVNLSRAIIIALFTLATSIVLLITDMLNRTNGLWVNEGYIRLYYVHIFLLAGITLFLVLFGRMRKQTGRVKLTKNIITVYILFLIAVGALTSGYATFGIHQQLTVYIGVCFMIAISFYIKPVRGLCIYVFAYALLAALLTMNQTDAVLLRDHYINAGWITALSWLLTVLLYNLKSRDILHEKYLSELVSERTSQLELSNRKLQDEVIQHQNTTEELLKVHAELKDLASIVQNSEDAIIGMSLDWTVTSWNKGAEKTYGYSAEEMIGESILKIVPDEKQAHFMSILHMFPHNNHKLDNSLSRRKDGEALHGSGTLSPIRNDSRITGASIIVRDRTVQKNLENKVQKLQKLNLIGEMAASISHEVRNPMTTVKGFLQMFSEKTEDANLKESYELMISEIDKADSIITEFLSISRTKATSLQKCKLNAFLESLVPFIEDEARAAPYEIILETDFKDTPVVLIDEKEIKQVVLNVVRNGIEAMEESVGKTLGIRTYTEKGDAVIAVSDQGAGIEPAVLEKLGTPFFTTKECGTGLGLAVCYGIIERHSATIEVVTSGEGTTFYIRFKPA